MLRRSERRASERTRPERSLVVELLPDAGGARAARSRPPLRARVLDLSGHGVCVALEPEAPAGAPRPGDALRARAPERDGDAEAGLVVSRVVARSDGSVLGLRARDDDARALLWSLFDRALRRGAPPDPAPALDADPPRIPGRGHYSEAARLERLAFARAHGGSALASQELVRLDPASLSSNVENLIGSVEIPVGLAGPLRVRGEAADEVVYAPLATTEGTLVAAVSRGARALTRSGGVRVRVLRQRMLRAPAFVLRDLEEASRLARFVAAHLDALRGEVSLVSDHAELVEIDAVQNGRQLHLRFLYETGDAAGQNMTTACTARACGWILRRAERLGLEIAHFQIEGNMASDKKLSFASLVGGRGARVTAEVELSAEALGSVLKVTPERLLQTYRVGAVGGLQAGFPGYNIDVANVVAGIFTATGQDIASVHESSLAVLDVGPGEAGGVYASLLLPSLIVGTVGGGTHLPAQRELLELLCCAGPGRARRLAEITAGFCLALEVSTLAAVANRQFEAAHERLGRNRPRERFSRSDLSAEFFEPGARAAEDDPELRVTGVEQAERSFENSIVSELSAQRFHKLIGLLPYRLAWRCGDGREGGADVIVKSKPLDVEVVFLAKTLARLCGEQLAAVYEKFAEHSEFVRCHERELAIYEMDDPRLVRHRPRTYRTHRDPEREAYVVVMERLRGEAGPDALDPSAWGPAESGAALDGIAEVHAIWLGRTAELAQAPWIGVVSAAANMAERTPLWIALAENAYAELPDALGRDELDRWLAAIERIPAWWAELDALPKTLVHGDFNPRNLALRREPGGALRLCAFDWELATLHVPQRDLAELLAYTLPERVEPEVVDARVEHHRAALERAAARPLDPAQWRRGYALALLDFAIQRITAYAMARAARDFPFLPRVVRTLVRLLEIERQRGGAP